MKNVYRDFVLRYASLIDSKKFKALQEILHPQFTMSGTFDIEGAENFIASLDQLNHFDATMHCVSNIQILKNSENSLTGQCYCIASHINNKEKTKLDMGIVYTDTLSLEGNKWVIKNRDFKLLYQITSEII